MDGLPSSSKFPLSSSRRKENASQAFDIVHRALSPRIAVLSSPDVDEILRPNNFGDLSDCLRPFEEILQGGEFICGTMEARQPSLEAYTSTECAFLNHSSSHCTHFSIGEQAVPQLSYPFRSSERLRCTTESLHRSRECYGR